MKILMRTSLVCVLAVTSFFAGPTPAASSRRMIAAAGAAPFSSAAPLVDRVTAFARAGQVFVTWQEGESPAGTTFNVYVASRPIRTLSDGRRIGHHIEQRSGADWWEDPAAFTKGAAPNRTIGFRLDDDGKRADPTGGLFVHSVPAGERGPLYFAITYSDANGKENSTMVVGANTTTAGVAVASGPSRPIWQRDQLRPAQGAGKDMPLWLTLHGKSGVIRDSEYLAFGDATLGWREGLPFKFSVRIQDNEVVIRPTDRAWMNRPFVDASDSGTPATWTFWYGYNSQIYDRARMREGTPTNYTERRLLWILDWVSRYYGTDRNRWYCSGSSMGGCGTLSFGWRHPELFAALHAHVPIVSYTYLGGASAQRLEPLTGWKPIPGDLRTNENVALLDRMDSVTYLARTRADLPFLYIVNGRQDGSIPWQNNPPFYHALEASAQGHAIFWDDGQHSTSGKNAPADVMAWTKRFRRFRLDESFPAFAQTSTNRNPGHGDPADGDAVGWMNRGMDWREIEDTPDHYAITLLAAYEGVSYPVTTDMTLRRVQHFRPPAGARLQVRMGEGSAVTATVGADGKIRVPQVAIPDARGIRISITQVPAN